MPITFEAAPSDSMLNIFFFTGVFIIVHAEKGFLESLKRSLDELKTSSSFCVSPLAFSYSVDSLLLVSPSLISTT